MSLTSRIALGSFIIILMLTMACQPQSSAAGPELPGGPVQISEEAARRLDDKIATAFQDGPGSQFTLSATDEEITSWVALRVAPQPDSHIENPQIRFTQGKAFAAITVTGILPFNIRVNTVSSASIVDERVQLKVEKSSAGIFPVPGIVLDYLTQTLNQMIVDVQLDLQVTSVDVLESQILVTGKQR